MAEDLLNLVLTTPVAQPAVSRLRVTKLVLNFEANQIDVEYAYGAGNGANFVSSGAVGGLPLTGPQVTTFLNNFLASNAATNIKTALANRLGTPLN